MPIEERPAKRPAPRTCKRCGQPINTQTDSWEMKHSDDGQYAVGIQHVTCPPSPELQSLPPASEPLPHKEGSALAPGVGTAPAYLTMDEAAALLRVSKGTIRNRIKSGNLPAKRLRGGQTVLVEKQDVLALLEDIRPGTDV
jgi:excisionase family DNA binding protein